MRTKEELARFQQIREAVMSCAGEVGSVHSLPELTKATYALLSETFFDGRKIEERKYNPDKDNFSHSPAAEIVSEIHSLIEFAYLKMLTDRRLEVQNTLSAQETK